MEAQSHTPQTLHELIQKVKEAAVSFGFKENENGLFRDCITNKKSAESMQIKTPSENDSNFWFGYIREDEQPSGPYNGLSFVIFPENEGPHCLVAIGIGSSSIGKDGDLASSPGFRRSFMRLDKVAEKENAKFFYKLRFDDMETSTPGLQEELFREKDDKAIYDQALINTSTKYNADSKKEAPGLLPAAAIVNYTTKDGWNIIKAWLAQYAQWRYWDKYKQKGAEIKKYSTAATKAINACKSDVKCPTPNDIYDILIKHRFVVLQGAPGCGKTWSANQVSEKFDETIFTQFHAETTYSDFVYGIRPTLNGHDVAYKGEKGILLNAIDAAIAAKKKKDNKVLLIIDEINRANLANVLGPVFYLFESNVERKHKLLLGTVYNEDSKKDEPIELAEIPDNLYVLATMNTADKSLAVVDFALRRRFAWVTLRPHMINEESFDKDFFNEVDNRFSKYATDEELNLQPGQSYFMDRSKREENIKYGLMPLLKEYFAEGFLLSAKESFAQLFSAETDVFMYE